MLEDRLQTEGYGYQVVNASIAGDTSAGGLSRLPRLLELHQPEIVVIELGGNDGLRGQPVATLRSNLMKMIELTRASGADVLLAGMQIPPNYGPAYTQAAREHCRLDCGGHHP
jgi:acyl-CoA thioesterase-1